MGRGYPSPLRKGSEEGHSPPHNFFKFGSFSGHFVPSGSYFDSSVVACFARKKGQKQRFGLEKLLLRAERKTEKQG